MKLKSVLCMLALSCLSVGFVGCTGTPTSLPPLVRGGLIVGSDVATGEYLKGVKPPAKQAEQAQVIYTIATDVIAGSNGDFSTVQTIVDNDLNGWNDPVASAAVRDFIVAPAIAAAQQAVLQYTTTPNGVLVDEAVKDVCTGIQAGSKQFLPVPPSTRPTAMKPLVRLVKVKK